MVKMKVRGQDEAQATRARHKVKDWVKGKGQDERPGNVQLKAKKQCSGKRLRTRVEVDKEESEGQEQGYGKGKTER